MKTLVVGGNSREAIIASRLSREAQVFAVSPHENPSLIDICHSSEGNLLLGSPANPELVAKFARDSRIDLAVVSSDNPLEAGVVDALQQAGISCVGPTRRGAEIEWNKSFAHEFLYALAPRYCPKFWIASSSEEVHQLFGRLAQEAIQVAVKPQGLTGGKGVKVMGEHLADFAAAEQYALDVLGNHIGNSASVVLEEKLEGIEFTIQAITDGTEVIRVPVTFDFPYRYDGDKGPGTGGMGSISDSSLILPFMTQRDYDECLCVIQMVLKALAADGRLFNGVLNTGFFLTEQGLRVMEFNSRFGDPEVMNILGVLDSSFLGLMQSIAAGTLLPGHARFSREACVVKYLVAPEYCVGTAEPHHYTLDTAAIGREGIESFFASSVRGEAPDSYVTTGTSRNVALVATDASIPAAAARIDRAIERHFRGPLDFRRDIGSPPHLASLQNFQRRLNR
jgi:phosphoribosylamine---glycine ligase